MSWAWWQVLVVIVVGLLTVRVAATFNVTEWLENRGMVFSGGLHVADQVMEEWARDPSALLEREKLFVKRAKRLYRLPEP